MSLEGMTNQPGPINDKTVLHMDSRNGSEIKRKRFGHETQNFSFNEGYFAKIADKQEVIMYDLFYNKCKGIVKPYLLPKCLGTGYFNEGNTALKSGDPIEVMFTSKMTSEPRDGHPAMIFQADLTHGYEKPCLVDFKIGLRSWRVGSSQKKSTRRRNKLYTEPTRTLKYHIRAAMWYGSSDEKFYQHDELCYVERNFGFFCTKEELDVFMHEFFKYPQQIPTYRKKLEELATAFQKFHDTIGLRIYSGSVVVVYDAAHPEKFDLRFLDFAKGFYHIEEIARKFGEPLDACEDYVVEGLRNLSNELGKLLEQ